MKQRQRTLHWARIVPAFLLAAGSAALGTTPRVEYLRCTFTDRIGDKSTSEGILIYEVAPGQVRKWSRDWGGLWNGNDCERGGICIVNSRRVRVTQSENYEMKIDRITGAYSLTIDSYVATGKCAPTTKPIVHPGRGPHGEDYPPD